MATLLYTIFSFTAGASLHCAVRREISPCTCSPHQMFANTIIVTCEKMESFGHVVDVLQDKFTPDYQIWLKITHSQMLDFEERQFAEMNMNIKNLRLNFNNMRWVSDGNSNAIFARVHFLFEPSGLSEVSAAEKMNSLRSVI